MPLPPIFAECCATHRYRYALDNPWIAGGRVWASDAGIAVWTSLDNVDCPDDIMTADGIMATGHRLPDMPAFVPDKRHRLDMIDLPDGIPGTVPCEECRGTKVSTYDAEFPCYDCEGTGEWNNSDRVAVGPVYLMACYVALLRRHGVTTIRLPINPEHPVRFDGDGFSGLLQPMRPPVPGEDN